MIDDRWHSVTETPRWGSSRYAQLRLVDGTIIPGELWMDTLDDGNGDERTFPVFTADDGRTLYLNDDGVTHWRMTRGRRGLPEDLGLIRQPVFSLAFVDETGIKWRVTEVGWADERPYVIDPALRPSTGDDLCLREWWC